MAAKSKSAAEAILVCGSDEFKVSECARALVNELCPPADQTLGLEIVDGAGTSDDPSAGLKKVLAGLQTVGFFSQAKTVWLRDALFLGDAKLMKNPALTQALDELMAECRKGLLPGQKLVISSSAVDKRFSFFKAWQEFGETRVFDLPTKPKEMAESTRDFIESLFEKEGLRGERGVADLLMQKCADHRSIAMEVEKLSLYVMGRKQVTAADVTAVVSSSRETAGWDLADAFGRRNLAGALRVLQQLVFQKENAIGMIMGIESRIRDMIVFRESLDRQWARLSGEGQWQQIFWNDPPEAQEIFSAFEKDPRKVNPWRGGILAQQAAKFSMGELRRCHRLAVEAHEQMVSSSVPPEAFVELFLIKALSGGRNAA